MLQNNTEVFKQLIIDQIKTNPSGVSALLPVLSAYQLTVNTPLDAENNTLLHLASKFGHLNLATVLVNDYAADIFALNNQGKFPDQVGEQMAGNKVFEFLYEVRLKKESVPKNIYLKIEDERNKLLEEKDTLLSKNQEIQQELTDANSKLEKLQQQISSKDNQIKVLENELSLSENEKIVNLKQLIKEYEIIISKLDERCNQSVSKDEYNKALKEKDRSIAQLESDFYHMVELYNKVQEENGVMIKERYELMLKNSELMQKLDEYGVTLSSSTSQPLTELTQLEQNSSIKDLATWYKENHNVNDNLKKAYDDYCLSQANTHVWAEIIWKNRSETIEKELSNKLDSPVGEFSQYVNSPLLGFSMLLFPARKLHDQAVAKANSDLKSLQENVSSSPEEKMPAVNKDKMQ